MWPPDDGIRVLCTFYTATPAPLQKHSDAGNSHKPRLPVHKAQPELKQHWAPHAHAFPNSLPTCTPQPDGCEAQKNNSQFRPSAGNLASQHALQRGLLLLVHLIYQVLEHLLHKGFRMRMDTAALFRLCSTARGRRCADRCGSMWQAMPPPRTSHQRGGRCALAHVVFGIAAAESQCGAGSPFENAWYCPAAPGGAGPGARAAAG